MLRPLKLSLKKGQLTKGKKARQSFNGVRKVTFTDIDGSTKTGYYKRCKDETYPRLLAKYVVAFSVFVRTALGTRASEERLVYDEKGVITGTISLQVPDFIPLLTKADADYEDPLLKKWGNPDKQTLIDLKVAELLISAYKHKNDDLHPANMSVNGLIDWDDLYRELTSILKGARWGSGWLIDSPKEAGILREEDIRTFPRIPKRTHWPTNKVLFNIIKAPKNGNLWKIYKTDAFFDLEGDKAFKRQTYTAILKELLAYDEELLEKRLKLYLDNEDLNLDELSPNKRTLLLQYGNQYNLFDDLEQKPNPFVTHCIRFFRMEHKKFEKMILGMPEFREFMISLNNKPDDIAELKNWFNINNQFNIIPHNLEHIDQQYNYLWRECFKTPLETKEIQTLKDMIILANSYNPPENKQSHTESDLTIEKANSLIDSIIKGKKETTYDYFYAEINSLTNIIRHLTKEKATHLSDRLCDLKNAYYSKQPLTLKDNHDFINEIEILLKKSEDDRMTFKKWALETQTKLEHIDDLAISMKNLIVQMNELFEDLDEFTDHFKNKFLTTFRLTDKVVYKVLPLTNFNRKNSDSKAELKGNIPKSATPKYVNISSISDLEIKEPMEVNDLIDELSRLLANWLTTMDDATRKALIQEARIPYDAKTKSILYWGYSLLKPLRGHEIDDQKLEDIFAQRGWESTSFNPQLLKTVCLKMLSDTKKTFLVKGKDDTWWIKSAKQIAEGSGLLGGPKPPPPTIDHTELEIEAKYY